MRSVLYLSVNRCGPNPFKQAPCLNFLDWLFKTILLHPDCCFGGGGDSSIILQVELGLVCFGRMMFKRVT